MQRDRINKKLEDIRQALLKEESLYGLTVQKVVSEDNTVFILSERYARLVWLVFQRI
jgi:hypothetical protein